MMTPIVVLASLQAAATVPGGVPSRVELLPSRGRCDAPPADGGEVTVCARRGDRYRLPLPAERDGALADGPVRGESPRASVDGTAPCGIFAGQRSCDKREAARYGYGGGRDPLTVATKALRRLFDPDAELGAPSPTPRR